MTSLARPVLALVAGGALAALSVTGAFALVNDSARIEDNTAETGTFAHDVLIAPKVGPGCAEAPYTDGPMTAVFEDVTLDTDPLTPSPRVSVCVRNATEGTSSADLYIGVDDVVQTEVGACAKGEAQAGDPGCDVGAAGEVTAAAQLGAQGVGGACEALFGDAVSWTPGPANATKMWSGFDSGDWCEVQLELSFGGDDDVLARAQTDRVSFDVIIQLRDPST